MLELNYKESWTVKNWCFWTVVLEKTLESPLDCKEIQPVHPEGNQSWIFIGRTNAEAAAKSLQSCPTLCDRSSPGFSVPGILQARTLEWVATSSSNAWKWKVKVKSLSRVRLLATPWTAAYQAPPSIGFSRQEYWSGVPIPDVKSWLIWKDPDAGKDWGQEEKGMTEDEMVGWHHWLNGHEFG